MFSVQQHAHKKAADVSGGNPGSGARRSNATSEARTSESCCRQSDELMALPADKHANHCHDSASSHPGVKLVHSACMKGTASSCMRSCASRPSNSAPHLGYSTVLSLYYKLLWLRGRAQSCMWVCWCRVGPICNSTNTHTSSELCHAESSEYIPADHADMPPSPDGWLQGSLHSTEHPDLEHAQVHVNPAHQPDMPPSPH